MNKHSDVNLPCREYIDSIGGEVIIAFKSDLFLKGFDTGTLATVKDGQPFSGFPRVEGRESFR